LLSVMLKFSPNIKLGNLINVIVKKPCIYFVIKSMHEAISLLVNARTPHYA